MKWSDMSWSQKREFSRKFSDVNRRYDELQQKCSEWMDSFKRAGDKKMYRRYVSLWRRLNMRRHEHHDSIIRYFNK